MTREAMLILPHPNSMFADAGQLQPIFAAKLAAVDALAETFGGVTTSEAHGQWRNPATKLIETEPVTLAVVAYEASHDRDAKLREIASTYGRRARQFSVYVRYPDGMVEFLNTAPLWQAGGDHARAA